MISQSDGKIIIELELAEDEFNRNLSQAEGNTRNFGSTVKNLLATFGLLKAGAAVFGLIKDSIGAAMDRLDTMDQFERVMTAMTGSSKVAADSLSKIKDIVTGTAYGLDVAAASTQKFVTSGMEIGKATKQVEIWGDAVAFYGKGTNEAYSNVTDALSKMTAKGKVEMDQLNRLTDEGIPVVQMFADYTGRSMQDVQNALSKGDISSQEFMDTLDKAMRVGSKKFKGIAGAAKEAGASWTGTIDNMKAAITRGMTEIIKSVDKGMEKAGLGSLKDNIAKFGKETEKVLGNLGRKIPGLIKLLYDIKEPIILIGAAYAGIKLVGPLTDTYNKLKDLKGGLQDVFSLTKGDMSIKNLATNFMEVGKNGGTAGDSMKKIGGIMSNLPTLALAAGISAVVAGFVMLKNHMDNSPTQKFKKELDDTIKSMNEMQEATDKQIESINSEQNYYQSLRDELGSVVDANGKVKQGYEDRASFILGELNEAYGTEMKMIDGIIVGYEDQGKTLDDLMAKQKAQSILNAYKDDYDEAIKVQKDFNKEYGDIASKREKIMTEANKAYKKAIDSGLGEQQSYKEKWDIINKEWSSEDENNYSKARERMITNNKLVDTIEKANMAMAQGNYAEVEKILSSHTYNIANLNSQSIQQLQDNISEAQALQEANLTMYQETGDEKYQLMATQYAKDIEQMQSHLDAQKGVLNSDTEAYKTAWGNYMDAGKNATWEKAKDFNQVGKMLIDELKGGIQSKEIEGLGTVQKVGNNMVLTLNGMDYMFNSAGQLLGSTATLGIETGFKSKESLIYTKSGNIREGAIKEFAKGRWQGTGEDAAYYIAKGVEINGEKVKTKMRITKDGTIEVFNKSKNQYIAAGKAVCDGTKIGIDSGSGAVITSFGNVGWSALNTFKKAFGIKSPSRVMKQIGSYIMEGLGIGVDENEKIAINSMSDTADNMIRTAKEKMTAIEDVLPNFDVSANVRTNMSLSEMQAAMGIDLNKSVNQSFNLKNILPSSLKVVVEQQKLILQLDNGLEIAHWLLPEISKELAFYK